MPHNKRKTSRIFPITILQKNHHFIFQQTKKEEIPTSYLQFFLIFLLFVLRKSLDIFYFYGILKKKYGAL